MVVTLSVAQCQARAVLPATKLNRPSRGKNVVSVAKKSDGIEEAWKAQQELLAERRAKAQSAKMAGAPAPGRGGRMQASAPPPPALKRTVAQPKAEPKLVIDEGDEDDAPANPLGFLGKLFGKK